MKRYLFIYLAAMFLAGCASTKTGNDSFYFIQMSDPQFGFFNENKSFEKETELYRKAIGEANRLNPAFVIVTGDLVNKPLDTAQVNEYKKISAELNPKIPLYHVAGNHDVGNTPSPMEIETYRNNFGRDYYTFSHGKMLGIVLNSLYLHKPEKVIDKAREQEIWLELTLKKLDRNKWKQVLVFLHHPLFLKTANEPDEYFNIPTATRLKYLKMFHAAGIRYVFSGHYHRNAFGKDGELEMITTGPVGKPLGKDPSGFRIVKLTNEDLAHKYYSLDSIPALID